jgi:hypothetical protein
MKSEATIEDVDVDRERRRLDEKIEDLTGDE